MNVLVNMFKEFVIRFIDFDRRFVVSLLMKSVELIVSVYIRGLWLDVLLFFVGISTFSRCFIWRAPRFRGVRTSVIVEGELLWNMLSCCWVRLNFSLEMFFMFFRCIWIICFFDE